MQSENLFTPKSSKLIAFLKKYWWLIIIGLAALASLVILIISIINNGKEEALDHQKYNLADVSRDGSKYDPRVVKTFKPESGTAFKYNSPALYNDYLYLGTSTKISYEGDHEAVVAKMPDNYFYKLDLDFNVVWKYELGKKMVAGGAVLDNNGNIYFVGESIKGDNTTSDKESFFLSTLSLISLTNDGKFRWEKPLSTIDEKWDHTMITPAISTDNSIYVGHDHFYAYDDQGNVKWKYPTGNSIIIGYSGSPVIDKEGSIYFSSPEPVAKNAEIAKYGTENIRMYKFASNTKGVPIWSTLMGNEIRDNEGGNPNGGGGIKARSIDSTPALGVDEKSIVGIVGCTISKFDTKTGKLLWSIKPNGASGHINASPAIDNNDVIYVGTKSNTDSKFYAIKPDGSIKWVNHVGADLYNSPLLGDDNIVYVGSETVENGKYHALNMETGNQEWAVGKDKEAKIPDFSLGSALLYKGYVYIGVHSGNDSGTIDNTLFKIKVDANNYLPNAAWPRIHGGNSNNGRRYSEPF